VESFQRGSKAKIIIERTTDETDPNAMKKVTIQGSGEQIELAKGLIEEQLEEEKAFRQKQLIAAEVRGKKMKGKVAHEKSNGSQRMEGSEGEQRRKRDLCEEPQTEIEGSNGSCCPFHGTDDVHVGDSVSTELNGEFHSAGSTTNNANRVQLPDHKSYFEVCVSALDPIEAKRIWIQLWSKTERLNALNDQMTIFYNSFNESCRWMP
jgi:hypothetical protein